MTKTKLTAMTTIVLLATMHPSYAQIGFNAGGLSGSAGSAGSVTSPQGRLDSTTRASGGSTANTPLRGFPATANSANFNAYADSRWDMNSDGYINIKEWSNGVNSWYGSSISSAGTFAKWDMNSDGQLDRNEANRAFTNTKLFGMYDTNNDGLIDQSETARIPR